MPNAMKLPSCQLLSFLFLPIPFFARFGGMPICRWGRRSTSATKDRTEDRASSNREARGGARLDVELDETIVRSLPTLNSVI